MMLNDAKMSSLKEKIDVEAEEIEKAAKSLASDEPKIVKPKKVGKKIGKVKK